MELGLFQKQTVDLVMTAELRQAIGLLQYNTVDLFQFIQEQAVENPLIELEEPEIDDQFDMDFGRQVTKRSAHGHHDDVDPISFAVQTENHLLDDILGQINYLEIDEAKRDILKYIVLNLDDNGYLSLSTAELAGQLETNETKIETCLSILHQLEPIGIGARNIQECLLLQAKHRFPDHGSMHLVIENHLNELADKKWHDISQSLGVTLTEVKDIAELMMTLNPNPCAGLFNTEPTFLFPDLTIHEKNGEYTVVLGDRYLPKVTLNQDYLSLRNSHPQAAAYIQTNYQNYLWLINSIEQRQATIMKIAKTIIKEQTQFLTYGFSHLKPMTLKDIAEAIDMHESTVSRATRNKVIRTPVGSFEMSELFSAKLRKSDTGYASSAQVKLLLKQIIKQEDPRKPLSDQKLADILGERKGITVSRRTIAKYREELNILSSTKRKQVV